MTLDLKNGREIIALLHNDPALRRRLRDENPRFARLLRPSLSLENGPGARGMIAIYLNDHSMTLGEALRVAAACAGLAARWASFSVSPEDTQQCATESAAAAVEMRARPPVLLGLHGGALLGLRKARGGDGPRLGLEQRRYAAYTARSSRPAPPPKKAVLELNRESGGTRRGGRRKEGCRGQTAAPGAAA